ncbi:MAG: peptidylprolyl isomerase [Thermaerobacter sp.]|nr:peptidylprolyl isomerase [Thermaerobacter sp.]
MHRFFGLVAGGALTTILVGCGATASPPAHPPATAKPHPVVRHWSHPPAMTINPNGHYLAVIKTTAGTFTISLFAKQDPVAVNNFVFLAHHDFFNGNRFFRVLAPFIIQTGDPLNNGTGGPGYQWNGELPRAFPYQPGIVAMANANNPNTNGSQFFICTGSESETLNQDPIYTELGRVTQGWAVVKTIADGAVTTNPTTGEDSMPVHPYSIISVTIQASG